MNARERFDQTLARFIHRKRTFFTGSAAVWAALACLLLALAFIFADLHFEFATLWRCVALGSLLATAAALLGTLWVYRSLHYRRHGAIRELEATRTDLGQLLRTSNDLGDEERAKAMGFSPALVEALARQAGDEIERTPTEQLLPWRTIRRLAAAVLALVALIVVLALTWRDFRTAATRLVLPAAPVSYTELAVKPSASEFEQDQTVIIEARVSGRMVDTAELQIRPAIQPEGEWQPMPMTATAHGTFAAEVAGWSESFACRVVAGRARTEPLTVRFIDPPRVVECTVALASPDYTQLAPQTVPLQRVVGVVGSIAQFHFRLNHALVRGSINGPDGELQPVPAQEEFDFAVELAEGVTHYTMTGQDAEGLALKPTAWQVRGVPDQPPTAKIEAPAEDLRVTPITEIPLDVRFADDFGLAEIGIVLTIDGKETRLAHREFTDTNPRRSRLEYLLRLEDFGVEVNANVRLHAYAADRLPTREGRSVSDLRMIDIRPFKILYRLPDPDKPPLTSEEQQQLEEQLAKLDDAIKAQQEVLAETLREREQRAKATDPREGLATKQEQVAEQLQALREQAQQEEATPPENDQHLAAAIEHMQEAAKDLREPAVKEALQQEDEALAEMLRARNQLEQELKEQQQQQQQQQQQEKQQQPEPPPPLDDLAKRAEELAKKEQALAEQAQQQQQQAEQQAQKQDQQQAQSEQQAQNQDQKQQQAEQQAKNEQQQQDLAQQQKQAVAEANQLLQDVQQHPETTALAEQRMAEARDKMQEAAKDLEQNQAPQAEQALREAQQDLQRLAEHLRGLDQQNALETMEKARDKAEQAAKQLEQMAQQDQPQDQQQQQQQAEQQAQNQQQQQAEQKQAQNQQQQQAEQQAKSQQQQQAEQQAQKQQNQAQTPAEQREEVAREAETVADWLERMGETKTEEREKIAKRLNEARKELATEQLPEDIRQAGEDREQGREEQAAKQDQQAAERLEKLAKTFEQERKELVKNQLERLAQAEARTKSLAEEVEREAKEPTPPKPNKPTTNDKLSELAEDYQELRDTKMTDLGKELEKQVGPQNLIAGPKQGTEIPQDVKPEVLEPGAKRLRQLIDEIVEREMLIDRDRRVPEQYGPLVDTYFKELSDDARE